MILNRSFILAACLFNNAFAAELMFLRKDISVGDGPMPVIVADFNGDGRPDLALRNWTCRLPSGINDPGPRQRCPTGTVGGVATVLLNTGGGNFAPPIETVIDQDVPFDTYSYAADLNGDGKLDLIGRGLTASFLPGRGNGTFLQPREIQPGYVVATGDFNGDRITDLLLQRNPVFPPFDPGNPPSLPPTPPLELLLGNGAGFFLTTATIDSPQWTAVADFNRDGRSDLVTLLERSDTQVTLGIHLAQSDGRFRPPVRSVIESLPVAADFNRDGLPDLVTTAGIYIGKGDATFQPLRVYPASGFAKQWSSPCTAADFTGDGHLDLAMAHQGSDDRPAASFSLLVGKGDGTFEAAVEYAGPCPAGNAADLDGDARADFVTTDVFSNTVSVWLSRPPSTGPALRRAVSAASGVAIVAPGSLASIYLPTSVTVAENAAAAPWPARLGGISLQVRDSAGIARLAPLLRVSPSQINFQVPSAAALGEASLAIVDDRGTTAAGGMHVDRVAPALFLVQPFGGEDNALPIPAALGVRLDSQGRQTPVPVFTCPPSPGALCGPAAIPLPPAGDPTYLSFFGTGFRGADAVNVVCLINGVRVPVEFAGPQGTPGLDQINVRLIPAVRGNPPIPFGTVTITIDGIPANSVWLRFR